MNVNQLKQAVPVMIKHIEEARKLHDFTPKTSTEPSLCCVCGTETEALADSDLISYCSSVCFNGANPGDEE